jgi:nitrogen regulatory protein P-II 1
MKLVIAIIQPARIEAVKESLNQAEVYRMTVMDVQGYGQQGGFTEVFRGQEFEVLLRRKIMLLIAVNDDFVQRAVDAITGGARNGTGGAIGDGKIFVLDLENCFRIRTSEAGAVAI